MRLLFFVKYIGFIFVYLIIYLFFKFYKLKIKINKVIEGKILFIIYGLYKLDIKDYFKNIRVFKSILL